MDQRLHEASFFLDDRIIRGTFLTIASVHFAARAVEGELRTGEPALRGLVHAAIGALFVVLLYRRDRLARSFAMYALVGASLHRPLLVVAVIEAGASHCNVPEAWSACLGCICAMLEASPAEPTILTFHIAFLCAVGEHPSTNVTFAASCVALAAQRHAAPWTTDATATLLLLWWGAARAGVTTILNLSATRLDHAASTRVVVARAPYYATSILYGVVLWADASTQPGVEHVALTRFVHVAAVVGALVGVLPAWLHAHQSLRALVLVFPALDVLLCALRGGSVVLYARAASAAAIALAIACFETMTAPVAALAPARDARWGLRRTILCLYGGVHAAYAAQSTSFEDAVGAVFHYLIVVWNLCAIALEYGDATCRRIALVFTACELAASIQLALQGRAALPWMGAFAATSCLVLAKLASTPARQEVACFFKPVALDGLPSADDDPP